MPAKNEAPPRKFTAARLARLMEVASRVKCECPNHVAKIVEALGSFEDYSRACESQNQPDRDMHALLARESGRARLVMEAALEALLKFERLEV
ncbi:MAG TPA: hypothetical protein VFF73_35295 [Planctomycetota bacterium]|nr:hypothetical protein [Planctomycetota bacterium]